MASRALAVTPYFLTSHKTTRIGAPVSIIANYHLGCCLITRVIANNISGLKH